MTTPVNILNDAVYFWGNKVKEVFGKPQHQEYLFILSILESLQKDVSGCSNINLRALCQYYFDEEFTMKDFIRECKKTYIQVAVDDADTLLGARLALDISRGSLDGLKREFCITKEVCHGSI